VQIIVSLTCWFPLADGIIAGGLGFCVVSN